MKFVLLSTFFFFSLGSYGQVISSGFSLEGVRFQNIDRTLGSLRNSGPALKAAYKLEQRAESGLKSFEVSITAINPKSSVEIRRKSIVGNLTARFDRQFQINQSDFYLGYNGILSYRNGFYKALDQSHLYWNNFAGAGFTTSYIRMLNKSSELLATFRLPVIGLKSRSSEKRWNKVDDPSFSNLLRINHSNIKVQTLASRFEPEAEIEYRRQLSLAWDLGLFYRQSYLLSNDHNSSYKEIQSGIGVKFILTH